MKILTPWFFLFVPIFGLLVIKAFKMGKEMLIDEYPTAYCLIFGTLSTILASYAIAGFVSCKDIEEIAIPAMIAVTFLIGAILFSVDIDITHNKVIDTFMVALIGMIFFTAVILGMRFLKRNSFPWNLTLIASSLVSFIMRIVLWLKGK